MDPWQTTRETVGNIVPIGAEPSTFVRLNRNDSNSNDDNDNDNSALNLPLPPDQGVLKFPDASEQRLTFMQLNARPPPSPSSLSSPSAPVDDPSKTDPTLIVSTEERCSQIKRKIRMLLSQVPTVLNLIRMLQNFFP
eukprot:1153161-Pelagomonas_calceolata.AAC.3